MTVGVHDLTRWREAVADMASLVVAYRDDIERARQIPRPIVDSWRQGGWMRLWLPADIGGAEADPGTVLDLVEAVSALDGAVGWNLFIAVSGGAFAAYLPEQGAHAIWGNCPDVLMAGTGKASGRAQAVADGYRVSGRWSFASGVQNADWLCANCLVDDGTNLIQGADGAPEQRLVFVPADRATIVDTWDTGGLRGTGSHDFVLRDVFVPNGFSFDWFRDRARIAHPLYQIPLLDLFGAGLAGVALGIARHAIDALVEMAASKVPTGSRSLLKERPLAQIQVAQADALVLSAHAFLAQTLRDAMTHLAAGDDAGKLTLSRLRLAIVHAAESATEAVTLMYRAAGGSAVYSHSPLDRCMRDVLAATQHVKVGSHNYQPIGQVLFEWLARTQV
jgi:indole-3-acetate monooxygenase